MVISPYSPIFVFLALIVAIIIVYCIGFFYKPLSTVGRSSTIDGLRGYLAFFVFLHHVSVWHVLLHVGKWTNPPSNLYIHLGETSVVFFFMITGFLFFSKLIEGRSKPIDWNRLFLSRILRLTPMYLFSVCVIFLIVYFLSNGKLNEPLTTLFKHCFSWVGFAVFGMPNINQFYLGPDIQTKTIIAQVPWSLFYEWFFYCSLPLLALCINVIPPKKYILLGIAAIAFFLFNQKSSNLLAPFLSGISAAFLVRNEKFIQFSRSIFASVIIIFVISLAIYCFPTGYNKFSIALISLAFFLIVGGNSLFGLLTNKISRNLGDVSYSLYLLHGIFLFLTFNVLIGAKQSAELSTIQYWLLSIGVTPFLIICCFFTYYFIERNGIKSTNGVLEFLQSNLKDKILMIK